MRLDRFTSVRDDLDGSADRIRERRYRFFFSFVVRFSQETIDEENAALAASLRGEDSSTGAEPVPA